MLLTIDLGNTNIVFGLFKGKKLVKEWRFSTSKIDYPAIKSSIELVVVASVVPALDNRLKTELRKHYHCPVHFVTAQNIPRLKIKLKKKKEIGADRVVDVLAARELYGVPAIVVDFGTATTFDVISVAGEYLGGAIAPGLNLSREILHERTAKLPRVTIKAPPNVIGNDTVTAMQSGLVYGYVALIEGMIERIKSELNNSQRTFPIVIATGGLARLICKHTDVIDKIDIQLTLKGLRLIGEKNVRRNK